MNTSPHVITCRYCEEQHGDLLLCAPAKRVLDALYARGQRFDMPEIEFPDPVIGADALGPDTVLVANLVAKAVTVPVAGTPWPALVLTGQDTDGKVLPQWVYVASAADLRRCVNLISGTSEMAIRGARRARTPS